MSVLLHCTLRWWKVSWSDESGSVFSAVQGALRPEETEGHEIRREQMPFCLGGLCRAAGKQHVLSWAGAGTMMQSQCPSPAHFTVGVRTLHQSPLLQKLPAVTRAWPFCLTSQSLLSHSELDGSWRDAGLFWTWHISSPWTCVVCTRRCSTEVILGQLNNSEQIIIAIFLSALLNVI